MFQGKKDLQTLESASDEDGNLEDSKSEAETRAAAVSSDLDSDEEQRRYVLCSTNFSDLLKLSFYVDKKVHCET